MAILDLTYAANHYDPDSLPGDARSKVICSKHTPNTLIVFVHGFRGDALETWQDFDQLTIANDSFKYADILFFGYDAYHSNVLACSSFLFDLLNETEVSPEAIVRRSKPHLIAARANGYERIILVAHSLGAVVSRWTLVRAVEEQRDWRKKVKLLLFAPAHTGSDLASIATTAIGRVPWVGLFVEGFKARVPLIRELDPSSRILSELATRVRAVGEEPCLRASRVVIAEREIVVSNLPFPGDPCPDALRDTDHISVCKPSAVHNKAVRFLQELLP